jgi:hypothetical protein
MKYKKASLDSKALMCTREAPPSNFGTGNVTYLLDFIQYHLAYSGVMSPIRPKTLPSAIYYSVIIQLFNTAYSPLQLELLKNHKQTNKANK